MRFVGKLARGMALLLAAIVILTACSNEEELRLTGNLIDVTQEPGDTFAQITFQEYGTITFKLFPEVAPIAVEKFVALAERGFYEYKLVHRVVENALIQGGSMNGDGTDASMADAAYFDIEPSDYAKNFYGALCFAPDKNDKNFCQFYIINNKKSVDINADIAKLEEQLGDETRVLPDEVKAKYTEHLDYLKSISDEVKDIYLDRGGYYTLDGKNTVFGQVITGYEVLEAISAAEVVSGNKIDDEKGIFSKPIVPIVIESVKIIHIPLPEPTTVTEETTTEKTKKPKKTTKASEPGDAYTSKITIGDTAADSADAADDEPEPMDTLVNNGEETTEPPLDNEVITDTEQADEPTADSADENATSDETSGETADEELYDIDSESDN